MCSKRVDAGRAFFQPFHLCSFLPRQVNRLPQRVGVCRRHSLSLASVTFVLPFPLVAQIIVLIPRVVWVFWLLPHRNTGHVRTVVALRHPQRRGMRALGSASTTCRYQRPFAASADRRGTACP